MKTFILVFVAVLLAGLVLREINRNDRKIAEANTQRLAKWQTDATKQIEELRTSAINAARTYRQEPEAESIRAFGLLDMRLGFADLILKSAPAEVDTNPLKSAIDDARKCLALAPVPPAAAAAIKAERSPAN